MKISTSAVVLSSFLVASSAEEQQSHYLRKQHHQQQQHQKRQLQFGQDNGEGNLDSFFGDLQNGFTEDMINISSIQAMDPLVLMEEQTFQVEDFWNITTNCTAAWPVNVSVSPFTLTGLSTLNVDRFELVQDPTVEELGSNGFGEAFWGGITSLWNGTFDMLVSAETLVLEGSWIIETQDDEDSISCFLEMMSSELTLESMAFKVNLVNPVLEMKLDIGGTTNSGGWFGLGASESEADSFATDPNQMNFTYDSWTIEIENPDGEPTILNVSDIIEEWGSVFMDAFNSTTSDGTDLEGGMGGLDVFLQDQVNSIMKSSGFSF